MMISPEFLTPEECYQVDTALLSAKDKFSARVAVYALRCLKQIAEANHLEIEQVSPEQVVTWISEDQVLQEQVEIDDNFQNFFSQLVISSLRPLKKISAAESVPLKALKVEQVIHWFELQAKARLNEG